MVCRLCFCSFYSSDLVNDFRVFLCEWPPWPCTSTSDGKRSGHFILRRVFWAWSQTVEIRYGLAGCETSPTRWWWWGRLLETAVSRKASLLSFTVSMVKRIGGCQFRSSKKLSTFEGDGYVAFRDLRLVGRCYCQLFKTLHVWIGNNSRNQTPEHYALFITWSWSEVCNSGA